MTGPHARQLRQPVRLEAAQLRAARPEDEIIVAALGRGLSFGRFRPRERLPATGRGGR